VLFTKASDYAVRILCYLANTGESVCRTHSIAEGTGIPESFLAKILGQLGRAGFVRSHRGAHGGFQLALHGREITMLDVVEAVDGRVAVNLYRGGEPCEYQSRCPIESAWNEAESALRAALRVHTVADLAERSRGHRIFVLSRDGQAHEPRGHAARSSGSEDGME
jgi:Rrf2 family protein